MAERNPWDRVDQAKREAQEKKAKFEVQQQEKEAERRKSMEEFDLKIDNVINPVIAELRDKCSELDGHYTVSVSEDNLQSGHPFRGIRHRSLEVAIFRRHNFMGKDSAYDPYFVILSPFKSDQHSPTSLDIYEVQSDQRAADNPPNPSDHFPDDPNAAIDNTLDLHSLGKPQIRDCLVGALEKYVRHADTADLSHDIAE